MSKKMEEQQKYIDIIGEIDECYALMKNVRPLSASELKYFIDEFSIGASHNSNAIEGNTFTFDETKLLIEKGIVTGAHSLRESEDIVGYKQAFDFLYESVKSNKPITEEMNAYASEVQADCKRNAECAALGRFDWVALFHNIAKHHIEFENIHPFIDGNGRTGRLLLIYEMISLGLLPVDVRYEERDRYYAAISSYRDKEKYSTRPESKTEGMAKLLAESELASMKIWLSIYGGNK